ncbi:DUF2851 family protein [Pontibacter cellulosilyticus]|uniref:DUF2851 family protein n=1 Tax=Pontibacter cellulosilyticus TaxID=1720253 RepID=A0A923NAD5_9BACT|nr:DUF2851 family protein [Pontibacter cellulosilyticus]MBC5993320.1 DUF2851 family protein [Pontibacter cellulosilyticus]
MKEDFLHYIWRHQYFEKSEITTTDGEAVQVIRTGYYNTEAGPDFKEAIVKIGEVEWSGSVEVHLKASDWQRHQHHTDGKYEQVVLHVVWDADKPVYRQDDTLIPVLELQGKVNLHMLNTYQQLQQAIHAIPCAAFWPTVPEVTKLAMMERALIERLELKGEEVLQAYQSTGNDWEQTAYYTLLRSFGFKTNQLAFEQLTKALPFRVVRQHVASQSQLEALLFGQAGFLTEPADDYALQLAKEYTFLKQKYKLENMQPHQWNFLRMRPGNFPTVRLAQLAAVLHKKPSLFATLLELETVKAYEALFRAQVSEYWQQHYMLGRAAKAKQKSMGKSSAHNLVINVVVPLLTAYASHTGNQQFQEKAIALLEGLKEESNKYTRLYEELGWQAKSAADNQAALGLFRFYCEPVNCMQCGIGNKIMKQRAS